MVPVLARFVFHVSSASCLSFAVFLRLCGLLSVFRVCVFLPALPLVLLACGAWVRCRPLAAAARPVCVPPSCFCFAAPCVLGAVWCAFLTACRGCCVRLGWLGVFLIGASVHVVWSFGPPWRVRLGVLWSLVWGCAVLGVVLALVCGVPALSLSWPCSLVVVCCSLAFRVCSHVSSKFARPGAQVLAKFVGALAVSSEAAAAYHRCRKGVAARRGRGGVAFVSGCRLRLARLLVDPARASFPVLVFLFARSFVRSAFAGSFVELSAKSYTI